MSKNRNKYKKYHNSNKYKENHHNNDIVPFPNVKITNNNSNVFNDSYQTEFNKNMDKLFGSFIGLLNSIYDEGYRNGYDDCLRERERIELDFKKNCIGDKNIPALEEDPFYEAEEYLINDDPSYKSDVYGDDTSFPILPPFMY